MFSTHNPSGLPKGQDDFSFITNIIDGFESRLLIELVDISWHRKQFLRYCRNVGH